MPQSSAPPSQKKPLSILLGTVLPHTCLNLLNVGYFHVVFTVPDDIRSLIYQNQPVLYSMLFQAVHETLKELAANKKYLGAEIGFTSVLHT